MLPAVLVNLFKSMDTIFRFLNTKRVLRMATAGVDGTVSNPRIFINRRLELKDVKNRLITRRMLVCGVMGMTGKITA